MQHIILFLYFINISAGIAGLAAMAALHSRLRQEVTGSLLFVMSCLLASLVLTLVSYYLNTIKHPDYALNLRYALGFIIALLARLGILRALLFMKGISRTGSVSITAGVIAVHVISNFLAVTGRKDLHETLYLPVIFLVSLYLLIVGVLLLRGSDAENAGTVKTLLRRLGVLLLVFALFSTAGYFLFKAFPGLAGFHISFDYFFFLAWSLITVSVFLEYLSKPAVLFDNGRISPSFIKKFSISAREAEVIELVGKGLGNREIADKLCISFTTARTHIYNIFQKTGAKSRVDLLKIISGFRE